MLSALILLRHAAPNGDVQLDAVGREKATALADFLQLYNPTALVAAPDPVCTDTLAPLAGRLGQTVAASEHLTAAVPAYPGPGGAAHAAAWLASRAVRALPDPRRTTILCADSAVLAALLVAVAARDSHDLATYELDLPLAEPRPLPPGGGWILYRDDGRLAEVKALAAP